ncbi:MFS transporter [Peterkaempfera griseoplana]|uniref:hypothetical protein n=1 Tax=Peterkaempfera griseoplana TaxID=66896 RepID=UPI0006E1A135|nr:hypothetical protein [Peterkaempfera griseoplana]
MTVTPATRAFRTRGGRGRNRRPTAPTADRDWLLRCYLLRATDALAASVVTYAVPLLVFSLTGSVTWTGIAFLVEWVPRLAAIAAVGPLIDRRSPQSALLATSVLRIAAAFVAIIGLATGWGIGSLMLFGVASGALAEASFLACESLGGEATRTACKPPLPASTKAPNSPAPCSAGHCSWPARP